MRGISFVVLEQYNMIIAGRQCCQRKLSSSSTNNISIHFLPDTVIDNYSAGTIFGEL